jgi:hypothetical protein
MFVKLIIFNLHDIIGIYNIFINVRLYLITIVAKEDRNELSLTHLRGAGIEYIGQRHVGSYD